MRIFLQIIGVLLCIIALISLFSYLGDYQILSEYGKGFVWGKVVLLLIGVLLFYLGIRKRSNGSH
jgi:uncharacterized membrane protein